MRQQMTIQDIKDISLDLLKEFHNFCRKHEIHYSLAYGSLIGAIRHNGFIPWDDDIDIMMTREDYERFVSLYQDNDYYSVIAPEKGDSLIAYARLVDKKRTFVDVEAPWTNQDTGVWIDIFPFDGVEDDETEYNKTAEYTKALWKKAFVARHAYGKLSFKYSFWFNVKRFLKKIIYRDSIHRILKEHLDICKRYKNKDYNFVANMTSLGFTNRFPKSFFDDYITVKFEDSEFLSIKEFDSYLHDIFGNYMQLPPENKRKNHVYHSFYWIK